MSAAPSAAPRAVSQRPLWRTYLAFLGPMVLANILQSLSGSVNGVYIGQMLGTDALAAVAGMFPVVFFFIALVIGVGAGASVLIGQAWGAREPHKVKVAKLTKDQVREIAEAKMPDLNANDIDAAMKIIAGTARQMGIDTDL